MPRKRLETSTPPRSSTRRAAALSALAILACLGASSPVAGAATTPVAVPGSTTATGHPTTTLERGRDVYARPSARTRPIARVAALRPITGARTVLPVLGDATDPAGHRWLRVLVPGRPNGRAGWIRERGTTPGSTPWAIEVQRGRRRVLVRRGDVVVRTFRVIVGAPGTPTPLGRFFIEESVRLGARGMAGPYALALSARSSVLQEFDGGPGQIALHGRNGLGGTLGTAVSHGCIRLGTAAIRWLAARTAAGDRVTIRR
jgi:lipoprotein-anchoring transpeptidase ErfK/SrfK